MRGRNVTTSGVDIHSTAAAFKRLGGAACAIVSVDESMTIDALFNRAMADVKAVR
jgi:hypothetical protein